MHSVGSTVWRIAFFGTSHQTSEYTYTSSTRRSFTKLISCTPGIGDYLDKGDVFCEIVSEGTVTIEMPIPEKEIGDVRLGLPITMKVRGFPHKWFEAKVQSIAPVTDANGSGRIVIVRGELENSDGSLKSGMTGVGKILCGKHMIVQIASRRIIRWLRTEFWEYLP